jgi:hypothetical protein
MYSEMLIHPNTSQSIQITLIPTDALFLFLSSSTDAPSSASEIELHAETERLCLLAGAPELFPNLVPLNLGQSSLARGGELLHLTLPRHTGCLAMGLRLERRSSRSSISRSSASEAAPATDSSVRDVVGEGGAELRSLSRLCFECKESLWVTEAELHF